MGIIPTTIEIANGEMRASSQNSVTVMDPLGDVWNADSIPASQSGLFLVTIHAVALQRKVLTRVNLSPNFPPGLFRYYTCRNQSFMGFSRCGGFMRQPVFNERTKRCDNPNEVLPPCGTFSEENVCTTRFDGHYPAG